MFLTPMKRAAIIWAASVKFNSNGDGMKLSKSLIVLAAIALGLLTIASAKVMAVNHGTVGTGCRTLNPDGSCA